MTKTNCPRCDLAVAEHVLDRHLRSARCNARYKAGKLRARGLIPVELATLNVSSTHIANALDLFDLDCELHPTRADREPAFRGSGVGDQAWTDIDGVAMMEVVEKASKLLNIAFPEAARRLHEREELIGPFDTARRLGGDEETLRLILQPIDYVMRNGKRVPNTPIQMFLTFNGRIQRPVTVFGQVIGPQSEELKPKR